MSLLFEKQINQQGALQELLAFVPQPVYAVLLLFPVTHAHDEESAHGTFFYVCMLDTRTSELGRDWIAL